MGKRISQSVVKECLLGCITVTSKLHSTKIPLDTHHQCPSPSSKTPFSVLEHPIRHHSIHLIRNSHTARDAHQPKPSFTISFFKHHANATAMGNMLTTSSADLAMMNNSLTKQLQLEAHADSGSNLRMTSRFALLTMTQEYAPHARSLG